MRIMACALTALALLLGEVAAAAPRTPQEMLAAVEQVYAAGDSASLRDLLTDDFEFLSQQGLEFSVDRYMELLGRFFRAGRCTLSFSEDLELKCMTVGPRTWAIPNLRTQLTVTDGSATHEVENLDTLYLIEDMESGEVRIFRWIEEPTYLDGCE